MAQPFHMSLYDLPIRVEYPSLALSMFVKKKKDNKVSSRHFIPVRSELGIRTSL